MKIILTVVHVEKFNLQYHFYLITLKYNDKYIKIQQIELLKMGTNEITN